MYCLFEELNAMRRFAATLICLIGLLVVIPCLIFDAAFSFAADQTEATTEKGSGDGNLRDPEALSELKRATDFLTSLPRFHIKASVAYDVIQADGRVLQFEKIGKVYIKRPDCFYSEVQFDDGRFRQYWYDGKMLSLAERSKNLYTRIKAPPTIDAALDMMEGLFNDPQALSDLYYSDLSPLDGLALEADVVGDSLVNGKPCKHLAFRGKTVDWQIWVEQGKTPFIRKLAVHYQKDTGMPSYVAWLNFWETPERFPDDLFVFKVPADSQWIDMLGPMPSGMEKGGRP